MSGPSYTVIPLMDGNARTESRESLQNYKKRFLIYGNGTINTSDFNRITETGNHMTEESVRRLTDLGLEVDYIDQKWYGWEALHYAAYYSDPERLKAIRDRLGNDRINTLTVLSENALHILLEHGRMARSFNLSCQSGLDLKMSKIINKEQEQVIECVKILIAAKIDVNHSNFWNETPILIAIKRKYFQIVKLLCAVDGVDLDSCRDAVSGRTARKLLKEKKMVPKQACESADKVLFRLLKSGDEEGFLKYKGGKIRDVVNCYDGDNENNSSCTMLQYCFRRGLIAWHQEKLNLECDFHQSQDIAGNRLVQVFCQNGMAKCVQRLLDNGANIDFPLRKFENGRSLLEVGIIKSYYPFVALILGRKDIILTPEKIFKICDALLELLENASTTSTNDLNNTLSIVLNRLLSPEQDFSDSGILNKLMEVLKKGVKLINEENILLLLKFPGSLSKTGTVLEEIDPKVLEVHFDECVAREGEKIEINYDSFITNNSVHPVLKTFFNCPELHVFLNHVVFKILIMRKWNELHLDWSWAKMKFFKLNLIFHIVFYVLLNVYILCKFNNFSNFFVFLITVLGWICLLIFILKEFYQCVADWRLYWREKNNHVEVVFIISVLTMFITNAAADKEWIDIAAVLSVLSSNLVLLLLLQQVPDIARYIIILQTIIFYLRYIIFYFVQFLAFAICFYILFSKSDQIIWIDLPDKIFQTVILFTGNLDYMETPWKKDGNSTAKLYHNFEAKEVFSKIIFIIFVFFIAIILQNLLLGLLVTDMSNLHKTVKVFEQVARAGFIVRLESFFDSRCARFLPSKKTRADKREITVEDNDRTVLDDEEEQHLDFILTKKTKRINTLKKLYNYIRTKINEITCETSLDLNREVLEKLELLEEKIRNLHEINYFVKNK